ncbi:hypothetical protein IGI04_026087 [Brassica rapa subsp. trilocularis]|uniref:Cation-transporting P-type ATPase C-terminal domain-containing protein n=1 Tax=Brassica rapa subsp. trilocularis TaxID=1813537 RepID=A0ABQ7KXN6_BRACM|nr:hypothetical protein IGI04_026087 [Brassica rapa subsp. trilocularis]
MNTFHDLKNYHLRIHTKLLEIDIVGVKNGYDGITTRKSSEIIFPKEIFLRRSILEDSNQTNQARSLRNYHAYTPSGRYVATNDRTSDPLGRLLRSDRARAKARSLRSDRALIPLGRYVATGLEPKLGRYVAHSRGRRIGRYVATEPKRLSFGLTRLHSDRAGRAFGRYVATELWLELCRYVAAELWLEPGRYVATERDERSRPISARTWLLHSDQTACMRDNYATTELGLFGLNLQGYFFLYLSFYYLFRKYDLRGFSGGNSVVTVFDPNNINLQELDTYSHKCVTDMICQYFLAAARRKNYSGAELEGVVKSATSYALNRQLSMDDLTKPVEEKNIKITMEDFLHAIHEVQPAFGASTDDLERCSLFNCIATIDNVVWDSRCNEETFHFLRKSFRLNTSDFYSNQSPRTVPLPELGRPYAAELQARCLQPSPLQSLLWSHHDKESCGKRFSMSDMRKPDSWKLNEIFATGIVLGGYQAVMSVIFFWVIHKTDFCSDKFGVRSIRDNNDELMFAVYLQVSIISQALIFVTRSRSWSFVERPGALLMIAFVIAQLIATLIAVYANWTFAKVKGIGWGWAAVIWVYSILTYIPQDILKFAIRYILSGKAWVSMFDKRHSALTTRRDYGAGERQADWAREQRTQHGLQTRQEVNVFPENEGYKELSQIVEQAKKRAEIARLREIHTFKGHVESVVKLKGMDIDTSGHHYTL